MAITTTDYQALIEELNRLSTRMEELGKEQSFTPEMQEEWDILDASYAEALSRKVAEDEERQEVQRQERLASLKQPIATRKVELAPRQTRAMTRTPAHFGRLQSFRGETAQDDAYDFGLWLKGTLFKDKRSLDILDSRNSEYRQQVEGTLSAGGYTVPTPVSATIIQVVEEVSVAMRTARIWPMTSETLSIPKVLTGNTVYYPGEAAAITASETTWGNVPLTAVKKATLTKISSELLEDSLINFADFIATRSAYELAWQLDGEYILGDGSTSNTFGAETGLIEALVNSGTSTLGAGDTSWGSIELEDFNNLMGLLPDKYYVDGPSSTLVPCCWIMSRQFYASVVQKLLYAAGGNTTDLLQAGTGPQFLGYPIYFTARMPADSAGNIACFFGNFMEAVSLGIRRDVSLASSSEFAFDEDVLTVKATMRSNINVHEPGVTDTNAGAYVGMALAAV